MRPYRWTMMVLVPTLCACVMTPLASAEPNNPGADESVMEAEIASAPAALPAEPDPASPVADACARFDTALNIAAMNYEEFAYATAGTGNYVNYQDPNVERSNVIGRTALRESAAAALGASRIDGVPTEIADPMRQWSLHATKLVLIMGLRGGGDSLNNAANELNADAERTQMACAAVLNR